MDRVRPFLYVAFVFLASLIPPLILVMALPGSARLPALDLGQC